MATRAELNSATCFHTVLCLSNRVDFAYSKQSVIDSIVMFSFTEFAEEYLTVCCFTLFCNQNSVLYLLMQKAKPFSNLRLASLVAKSHLIDDRIFMSKVNDLGIYH